MLASKGYQVKLPPSQNGHIWSKHLHFVSTLKSHQYNFQIQPYFNIVVPAGIPTMVITRLFELFTCYTRVLHTM